jgi:C1A family cysteine protease
MSLPSCAVRYFWAIALAAVLFPFSQTFGNTFDWRAYPGSANLPAGNYITPIRNQGSANTCWAFCAVAALEANYDITNKITNSTLDLSEQNLVCAEYQLGVADSSGGYEDLGTQYIQDVGITTESKVPYNQTYSSPNFPLKAPYALYKITDMAWHTSLQADPASIKQYLQTGPVEAAIRDETDFVDPKATSFSSPTTGTPDLDHSVLIVGYVDASSILNSGGGYYIVKNSWGRAIAP